MKTKLIVILLIFVSVAMVAAGGSRDNESSSSNSGKKLTSRANMNYWKQTIQSNNQKVQKLKSEIADLKTQKDALEREYDGYRKYDITVSVIDGSFIDGPPSSLNQSHLNRLQRKMDAIQDKIDDKNFEIKCLNNNSRDYRKLINSHYTN